MADHSTIEWTDTTWNPLAGCKEVSPGCTNCYAATMAHRLAAMAQADLDAGRNPGRKRHYIGTTEKRGGRTVWNGNVHLIHDALRDPLSWDRPRKIFVNSMSDLFHEGVPDSFIDAVFAVMALADWHVFQILTKRPERAAKYINGAAYGRWCALAQVLECQRSERQGGYPLPNVWIGTSCENQEQAEKRIPHLLNCQASVRFLSCEPLLGPIDLSRIDMSTDVYCDPLSGVYTQWCDEGVDHPAAEQSYGGGPRIHWIIAGGESGHHARPLHPNWVRSLRDQCQKAGVPFFFKQWGEWGAVHQPVGGFADQAINGTIDCRYGEWHGREGFTESCLCFEGHGTVARVGKKRAGRVLDGREWNEIPDSSR